MLKKLMLSLILSVLVIGAIELICGMAESSLQSSARPIEADGWQARFFAQMGDWHEPDPDLLWRFRSNLEGPLVRTDNEGRLISPRYDDSTLATFKILLLGDSSPVGLGLKHRAQAFGDQLEGMLELAVGGQKDVRLMNAAVSGYSSAQIARQVGPLIEEFEPNLVLLYCGNNDASISGAQTDEQLLGQLTGGTIKRWAGELATYRMIRALIFSWSDRSEPESGPPTVRVTEDQYGENLSAIAIACREANVPAMFIKPVVPRLWPAGLQFKPFLNRVEEGRLLFPQPIADLLGRELYYCLDSALSLVTEQNVDPFTRIVFQSAGVMTDSLARQMVNDMGLLDQDRLEPVEANNLGVALWKLKRHAEADSMFKQAIELWRENHTAQTQLERAAGSPFEFNAGVNLWSASPEHTAQSLGPDSPGYDLLDQALQDDFFSLRIKRCYLEQYDRLDQSGVMIISLDSLFAHNGGETLFVDHCHPTAEGHRLIAGHLAQIILDSELIRGI